MRAALTTLARVSFATSVTETLPWLHHMNFKGAVSGGRVFTKRLAVRGVRGQDSADLGDAHDAQGVRAVPTAAPVRACTTPRRASLERRQPLAAAGVDLTALCSAPTTSGGYAPPTLAGHREPLVHVAFAGDAGDAVFTVSKDGAVFEWRLEEEETDQLSRDRARDQICRRKRKRKLSVGACAKHFFHQPAKLTCASYHRRTGMLCAGFGHGVFTMHRLSPDRFDHVQTLSVSQEKVSACSFDETGDWIARRARLGQLVVWEWQSEAYVYKQQGHYFDVNACAYAPDGSMLATAADDHKVKVWSASIGVRASSRSPNTKRCFARGVFVRPRVAERVAGRNRARVRSDAVPEHRVMTSPDPCQFVSLAVTSRGKIVCAGA